ncbi:MAG: hypothetical protein ACXVCO_12435, partial [Ktedonobacterales bacterium]
CAPLVAIPDVSLGDIRPTVDADEPAPAGAAGTTSLAALSGEHRSQREISHLAAAIRLVALALFARLSH